MIVSSLQCIYSFNGEQYAHNVALEIERSDRFAYTLTMSSIEDPSAARSFQCHPYVLAAVLQGSAITITDATSIEVTFWPEGGLIKLGVRDLTVPYEFQTSIAGFKLEDLVSALKTLQGV